MEEKQKRLYFTPSGLLLVMILAAIAPVGMNLLAANIMLQDHLWIALLSTVLSLFCLFTVDAAVFSLWRSKLTQADQRRIGILIPLILLLAAAFIPVFTAVESGPAILTLHEVLH